MGSRRRVCGFTNPTGYCEYESSAGPGAECGTHALLCAERRRRRARGVWLEYRRFSSNTQEPSWIGLGVGDMGMIDSDMVVADFTDDLPGLLLEEYWSVTYGNPISKITLGEDAQNGLGDCGFETFEYGENMSKSLGMATSTYLQFSRPLVADSEYSRPLVPGTINEMVYAVGFNFIDLFDTFEYHGPINRGRFQINLPSGAG